MDAEVSDDVVVNRIELHVVWCGLILLCVLFEIIPTLPHPLTLPDELSWYRTKTNKIWSDNLKLLVTTHET